METNQISRVDATVNERLAHLATLSRSAVAKTEQGSAGDDVFYVTNNGDKITEAANGGIDSVYSNISHTLGSHVENLILGGTENIYGAGNNLNNTLIGNGGHNRLNSGRGNDTVYGGAGNDTINGGTGNDMLFGEDGNDVLNGEAGNDTLQGGAGHDVYVFGKNGGQDTIIDDSGNNSIRFADGITVNDVSVTVGNNANGGQDWKIALKNTDSVLTVSNQYRGDANLAAIKTFVFNGKAMGLAAFAQAAGIAIDAAKSQAQNLTGTDGSDTLEGGSGDDVLNGLAGADIMAGHAGDDTYHVDHAGDVVDEDYHSGNDTVISSISYTAPGHVENVTLTGSAHLFAAGNNEDNTLTGNSGNNRLNSGRGNDTVYGMEGNDQINGGAGDDNLDGGNGNDVINGDAGNDKLNGGAGRDILRGGAGNDTYVYGDNDIIMDNQGNNTLEFAPSLVPDSIKLEVIDHADGSKTWKITSADGSATIQNQIAADGRIAIDAFKFGDQVYTAAGLSDALKKSGTEYREIRADGEIKGTEGNDKIYGGDADDILDGGRGDDYLEGKLGADTYVFGRGYGKDTLFDFNFYSDEEFLSHRRNPNTVKFKDGLTLNDLEITVSPGYDTSSVEYLPQDSEFLNRPVTDGDTWKIRIKGTDDVLTILNQDPALGAVETFQFDSLSYTAGEVYRTLGTPEQLTAMNDSPVNAVVTPGNIHIYGTNAADESLNHDSRFHRLTEYNTGIRHVYGGEGNDDIYLSVDDNYGVVFYGGNGDDKVRSLYRHKVVFDGGKGNDTLEISGYRDNGELVFRAGDGQDTIRTEGGADIHFSGGLTLDDLNFSHSTESIVINLKNSSDSVTVHTSRPQAVADGVISFSVDEIRFDSGERHQLSDLVPEAYIAPALPDLGSDTVSHNSQAVKASVNTKLLSADNAAQPLFALLDDGSARNFEGGINRITTAADAGIGATDNMAYAGSAPAAGAVNVEEQAGSAALI